MSRAWMPLYVGDFLADTMHLNATETGIYMRLIMHCWQHGSIPRDDRTLALIGHCDTRVWHQYRETVLRFFDVVDASTLHHKRVDTERHRSEEISSKRKAAAMQKHMQKACKDDAKIVQLDTQSQSQSQSLLKKDAAVAEAPALFPDQEADLFRRGKEVLGKSAGGMVKRLLVAKEGKINQARAALETAAGKHDPREYIGGIIKNKEMPDSAERRVDPRL